MADSTTSIEALIASTLGISIDRAVDHLAFAEIPEWDSLNHVNLMTALEVAYSLEIDEDLMVELVSVADIRALVTRSGE